MNLSFSVLELCYLVLKMYLAYSVRDFFSFKKLIFLWYLIKKKNFCQLTKVYIVV